VCYAIENNVSIGGQKVIFMRTEQERIIVQEELTEVLEQHLPPGCVDCASFGLKALRARISIDYGLEVIDHDEAIAKAQEQATNVSNLCSLGIRHHGGDFPHDSCQYGIRH
jgi:hypothetical protein